MSYERRRIVPIVRFLTKDDIHEDMYSVVLVETQKNIRSVGTFAVSLVTTPEPSSHHSSRDLQMFFYEHIQPMDVVEIAFKREGRETKVFTGIVDRVAKTMSVSGHRVRAGVTISGRDFQKIFVENVIAYYPQFDQMLSSGTLQGTALQNMLDGLAVGQLLIDHETWLTKSLKEGLDYVIQKMTVGYRSNIVVSIDRETGKENRRRIRDFIDVKKRLNPDPTDMISAENAGFRGRIWDLLRAVLGGNYVFYELFAVTISAEEPAATLVLRRKPFDPSDWESLRTWDDPKKSHHTVEMSDLKEMDIGRSDLDTATSFKIWPANTFLETDAGLMEEAKPELLLNMMETYGFRPMEITTTLSKQNSLVPKAVGQMQKTLKDWFKFNPWFEAGMLTIKGTEIIKIGEKVLLPFNRIRWWDRKIYPESIFYVEGVKHTWRLGAAFVTRLKLTRGQPILRGSY